MKETRFSRKTEEEQRSKNLRREGPSSSRRPPLYSYHKQQMKELFKNKQQSPQDVSRELIKADCMNHGYRLLSDIGEGAYAKVKLAEVLPSKLARNHLMASAAEETGELQVAIKVVTKKLVPKDFYEKFLPREIENHMKIPAHASIVRLYEQFATTEHVYLVMEYCCHGDLLDRINRSIEDNQKGIGEEAAKKVFISICKALHHLHLHNVVHRDVKCENILLDFNHEAKLTDFGFSSSFQGRECIFKTSCGSYAYTAPEIIRGKPYNGIRSDIWSLGIILFAMVNGCLPFNDNQLLEMDEEMKMQRLRFERTVSFDCMLLIRKILQYQPSQRPTLPEIMDDIWLTGKKPIPRQNNRPKWVNNYDSGNQDTASIQERSNLVLMENVIAASPQQTPRSTPICYKSASPRSHASRTVKLQAGETVTLKSHRHIHTVHKMPPRPNTWPKTAKAEDIRVVCKKVVKNHISSPPAEQQIPGDGATPVHDKGRQMPIWYMYKAEKKERGKSTEKKDVTESLVSTKETQTLVPPLKVSNSPKLIFHEDKCSKQPSLAPKLAGNARPYDQTTKVQKGLEEKEVRTGFPQRVYTRKPITVKPRAASNDKAVPIKGCKKPMTPKSANSVFWRWKEKLKSTGASGSKSSEQTKSEGSSPEPHLMKGGHSVMCSSSPDPIASIARDVGDTNVKTAMLPICKAGLYDGKGQASPTKQGFHDTQAKSLLSSQQHHRRRFKGARRLSNACAAKHTSHKVVLHSCC